MGFLQSMKHHFFVQRGEGFKPLRNSTGDFIYNEKERHLAASDSLSNDIPQQSDSDKAVEKGNCFCIRYFLAYLIT